MFLYEIYIGQAFIRQDSKGAIYRQECRHFAQGGVTGDKIQSAHLPSCADY
jgi:hypothetical protein